MKVSRKSFRAVLAGRGGALQRFLWPITATQIGRKMIHSGTVSIAFSEIMNPLRFDVHISVFNFVIGNNDMGSLE